MPEIALVAAGKTSLQRLVDDCDSSVIAAVKTGKDSTRFLSAAHIGITGSSFRFYRTLSAIDKTRS